MHPIPTALFSVDNQCQDTPLCFTDLSSVGAPDAITSYIYNFGDVSPFDATPAPCHLYTAPGDYNVTLIVSTNNGCIDDVTTPLTVHPEPEINLSATTICVNQPPTEFTNLSSLLAPDNFQTWTWDFGDGYSSSLENPSHSYLTADDYTVVLTGVTNNNCTETAQITVTVYEKPTASFTSNIVDSCTVACINFESTSSSETASITEWEWIFNNGETASEERPSSCFENLSNTDELTYDITLITSNDLGCYDTITSEDYITVWHNPIADFDANSFEIEMYSPDFEFYNLSTGEDAYDWNFGDTNTSNLENPFHTYSDTGTYDVMLIASTVHNCTDTVSKPFRVKAVTSIYAPNTFTPDGDNVNDIFKVVGYNLVEIELLIFDRWGTLLYTGIGLDAGWDGTYKGEKSQQDAYIWTAKSIDGLGKRKSFTGHITLLR
jgi:gliding motility-associated-like protein